MNGFASHFSGAAALRIRLLGLIALLAAANLAAWGLALAAFHPYPILIGTARLASSTCTTGPA